jgi:hypothetical protein
MLIIAPFLRRFPAFAKAQAFCPLLSQVFRRGHVEVERTSIFSRRIISNPSCHFVLTPTLRTVENI